MRGVRRGCESEEGDRRIPCEIGSHFVTEDTSFQGHKDQIRVLSRRFQRIPFLSPRHATYLMMN